MDYFWAFIGLLAGLGAFLFGFKVLSESIEKLANSRMRRWFDKTAKSKLAGVGIGTVTTAIIQSSSATTVMAVGFVNAGIMTLYQATAIIMGANIGTPITAQIASLQAFDFIAFVTVFACVGVFMDMLSKNEKIKTIGVVLAGLGLVFLGLQVMSDSMSIFRDSQSFKNFLTGVSNPFLLLLIGAAFTALVQSSSAVTSLIIVMVGAGLSIGEPGSNGVLFLVLGSNIGTCITAILSSVGASTNAKRASLIHLMFNVFGSIIFTVFLLCWPSFMQDTLVRWFPQAQTQIAMFHTFFNVICVAMFLPFTSLFVKIATKVIREKKEKSVDEARFLDERILQTPAIALNQATKETDYLAQLAMQSLSVAFEGFIEENVDAKAKVDELNVRCADLERRIVDYLIRISSNDVSYGDEKIISALHHGVNDIVRISELADNITRYTANCKRDDITFSDSVKSSLKDMFEKILALYASTKQVFAEGDVTALKAVDSIEDEIDHARRAIVDSHIRRLNDGRCRPASSGVFINLVGNLERAADHLTYLAHSFDESPAV